MSDANAAAEVNRVKALPSEVDRIVFGQDEILDRVTELADRISRDYREKNLLLAGVLKGAALFTSDLVRRLSIPVDLDFLAVSSYSPAPDREKIRVLKDLGENIRGRHVLLVEDIIDTGLTLHFLVQRLRQRRPASLRVCTLLNRPDLRLVDIPLAYEGFEVEQEFLIGYGLDFREHFRDLPYIARMRTGQGAEAQG